MGNQLENICKNTHDNYERASKEIGWQSQCPVPWESVPEKNKQVMRAALKPVSDGLTRLRAELAEAKRDAEHWKSIAKKECDLRLSDIEAEVRAQKDFSDGLLIEIGKLEAIIDRLPKTADGVVVVPYKDSVFAIINDEIAECGITWFSKVHGWVAKTHRWDIRQELCVSHCYSTRQAAEAARKETK